MTFFLILVAFTLILGIMHYVILSSPEQFNTMTGAAASSPENLPPISGIVIFAIILACAIYVFLIRKRPISTLPRKIPLANISPEKSQINGYIFK